MVATPYEKMLQPSLNHSSHIFSVLLFSISVCPESGWGKLIEWCLNMYLTFHHMKWGRVKQWGQSPKTTPSATWHWGGTARNQNLREQGSRQLPSVDDHAIKKSLMHSNFFLSETQEDALVSAHAQWTYIDTYFVVWSQFLATQSYCYNWPQVVLQHTLVVG